MELPAHPLLALVESNKKGLKSMLTSYIDDTVDNQFAFLTNSILKMIQSGQIGPHIDDVTTTFGQMLPPPTQTITDQTSASCLNEYSNDQLTINHRDHLNTLQNYDTPLFNTNSILIKQEFNDDDDDEGVMDEEEEEADDDLEKINNVRVQECKNCIKGICYSIGKKFNNSCGDDSESGENGDEPSDEPNDYASVENNQINQPLIISNDQKVVHETTNENNTNNELQINDESVNHLQKNIDKVECPIQAFLSSIKNPIGPSTPSTSAVRSSARKRIPKKFFEDIIQTNVNSRESIKCRNENIENSELQVDDESNNRLQKIGDKLESSIQAFLSSIKRTIEPSTPSTSAVRLSALKRVPKKSFEDLHQSNVNSRECEKSKNVQSNKTVNKKVKLTKIEDKGTDVDSDDQEEAKSPIITLELQCTESDCSQAVSSRAEWRDHMRNDHHKSDPYHQIEKNAQLKERGVTVYRCAECNAISTTQSKLRQHWRRYHQPGKFKCKSCDFVQNFRFKVQKHFDATHGSFANIRITTPFAFTHKD